VVPGSPDGTVLLECGGGGRLRFGAFRGRAAADTLRPPLFTVGA
jgi:hypothetical protein